MGKIKQGYEQVLNEKRLALGHTPHVVIFCVQADSLKNLTEKYVQQMQAEFSGWMQSRKFPIKVLPVVTFIDTVGRGTSEKVKEEVLRICHRVFDDIGAHVHEHAIATACKEHDCVEQGCDSNDGVDDLRQAIENTLHSQVSSKEFRNLWLCRLAQMVQTTAQDYAYHHPTEESAWRLFIASLDLVATACDKQCVRKQVTLEEEPPWWVIDEIPLLEKQRRNCAPAASYWRRFVRSPVTVPVLLLVVLFLWHPWGVLLAMGRATATTTTAKPR